MTPSSTPGSASATWSEADGAGAVSAFAVLAFARALGTFLLETERLAEGFELVGLLALSLVALTTTAEPGAPPP
jgi:hypothetical protein